MPAAAVVVGVGGGGDQGIDPARARARDEDEGTDSERAERRWPRGVGGGARPALGFERGWAAAGRSGEGWRGLDEGGCCADGGFRPVGADGVRATFLKAMVHLTSSPAKTTCSCQRTKTRMLLAVLLLVLLLWPTDDMARGGLQGEAGIGVVKPPCGQGDGSPGSSNRWIEHC